MKIHLETDRLVLRQFTDADFENLCDLDSDPEVMRFINGGLPTEPEVIRGQTLPRFFGYYEKDDQFGYWAAIEKGTGQFLGWFHFRPSFDCPEEIELGYRLKQAGWGRGFATEGARALIRKGFVESGVERIVATALAANRASIRAMEKAGLKFEHEFIENRFPGSDRRAVKYSLNRADFVPTGLVQNYGGPGRTGPFVS